MSNSTRVDDQGLGRKAEGKRRRAKKLVRKPKPLTPPIRQGRPPRLAHLLPDQKHRLASPAASGVDLGTIKRGLQPANIGRIPATHGARSVIESGPETLCLPNPEWLAHCLTITGPAAALATFRMAATGSGLIPWQQDYERMEEDWVNQLLAPAPPMRRISLQGAKIAARQMRTALERIDTRRRDEAHRHVSCPLDLNALIPVPDNLLSRAPGDPLVLAWLWENWGTTWPLRDVIEIPADEGQMIGDCYERISLRFFSADWTPWRALTSMRMRWAELDFAIKPLPVTA